VTNLAKHLKILIVHCSAYSRRLQQELVPDLTADAVAADVLPDLPVQLAEQLHVEEQDVEKNDSVPSTAYVALQAYPCISKSSTGADSTSAGWTVSQDTDIDAADVAPYSWHQQKFIVQRQQEPNIRRQQQEEPTQPLPQPVLTVLPWQQQQQQQHAGDAHDLLQLLDTEDVAYKANGTGGQLLSGSSTAGNSRSSSIGGSSLRWNAGRSPYPSVQLPQVETVAGSPAEPAVHQPVAAVLPAAGAVAAAAGVDDNSDQLEGGFIGSRAEALQQLKQQQLQVQREHVLAKSKQQLYRWVLMLSWQGRCNQCNLRSLFSRKQGVDNQYMHHKPIVLCRCASLLSQA
jgi:hypothetical protein